MTNYYHSMIMIFYCCKMTLKKWNIKIFFLYYHCILRTFEQKIESIKQSYLRIISDMISKIFALVRSQFETELFTVHFETRTSCLLLRECHIMATWVVQYSIEGCKIRYCTVNNYSPLQALYRQMLCFFLDPHLRIKSIV